MCWSLSLQYAALQLLGEERFLRKNGLDKGKEKQGKRDSARPADNREIETQRAAGEGIMVGQEVPGDPSGGGEGEGEAEPLPAHVRQLSTLSTQQLNVSWGGGYCWVSESVSEIERARASERERESEREGGRERERERERACVWARSMLYLLCASLTPLACIHIQYTHTFMYIYINGRMSDMMTSKTNGHTPTNTHTPPSGYQHTNPTRSLETR
jgi:hypothetical protein